MSDRPKMLDAFCGCGGASAGYVRAGWDVTGVDNRPMPRYLLSGATAFVQADALEYIARHGHEYDCIHASPPCQRYTVAASIHNSAGNHPDLVAAVRDALIGTGKPWVIENVIGAPMGYGVVLCGLSFGLRVIRHRVFESSIMLFAPTHRSHPKHLTTGTLTLKRGGQGNGYSTGKGGLVCVAGNNFVRQAAAEAMGIGWMTRKELANAIPPAYAFWIGKQLLRAVEGD